MAELLLSLVGTVLGGVIVYAGVKAPLGYLVDELKRLKKVVEEGQEKRLTAAERAIREMKSNCDRRGPLVERHEEELRGVNVELLNERDERNLRTILDLDGRLDRMASIAEAASIAATVLPDIVERVEKQVERVEKQVAERVDPTLEDTRNYVKNVSRKVDRLVHDLEKNIWQLDGRLCRIEGRPPPSKPETLEPEEEGQDAA